MELPQTPANVSAVYRGELQETITKKPDVVAADLQV